MRARRSLRARLLQSARCEESSTGTVEEGLAWLSSRSRADRFDVEPVRLSDLLEWRADRTCGDLVHRSGRFFKVCGLRVRTARRTFDQPFLLQPEVGVLGFLVREIDGCLHFLMQAKAEPGNPRGWQLAPTVQATPSNYTRVHGGDSPPLLDRFLNDSERVLVDVVQSEHEAVFLGKKNRNMVVEEHDQHALGAGHRWFTLGQIARLLNIPNLVNMDTRSVLSCLPLRHDTDAGATPDDDAVTAWLKAAAPPAPQLERVGLSAMRGWRGGDRIAPDDGEGFAVMGVRVSASCREVARWDQPMVAATVPGLVAFVMQRREGRMHVLGQACHAPGAADGPLIGPTVRRGVGDVLADPDDTPPPFLSLVTSPPPGALRYDVVHSEEGGRFHMVETVHRIVEIAPDEALDCPPAFRWLALSQLERLVTRRSVSLHARSLLACLAATRELAE